MKALQITKYGSVSKSLVLNDIAKPSLTSNQIVIKVKAAAINPVDFKTVEGDLKMIRKMSLPTTIGFDVAGIVVDKGSGVTDFQVGDEVYANLKPLSLGAFAEYVVTDSNVVSLKPSNIDFVGAASLPLVGLTTLQAMNKANLKKGDNVLIHAGSGGVGTFAIQYAKNIGAKVYTTTSIENVGWVKDLGADRVIDYKKEDYKTVVSNLDIVFDTLGDNYTFEAFDVIKKGGMVVSLLGDVDDEFAREHNLNGLIRFFLKLKRRKVTKLAKAKSANYKFVFMKPDAKQLNEIKHLIESESIRPIVDKTYSLDEYQDAFEYLQTRRAKGKVVFNFK